MYWQQMNANWIDRVRYFIEHRNELTTDEIYDAFVNVVYSYVVGDFTSLKMIESKIMEEYGPEGELFIQKAVTENDTAKALEEIDIRNGRDIRSTVLETLDFIENNKL